MPVAVVVHVVVAELEHRSPVRDGAARAHREAVGIIAVQRPVAVVVDPVATEFGAVIACAFLGRIVRRAPAAVGQGE